MEKPKPVNYLDMAVHWFGAQSKDLDKTARTVLSMAGKRRAIAGNPNHVITSYSIHYTKLYDEVIDRLRLFHGALLRLCGQPKAAKSGPATGTRWRDPAAWGRRSP